MYLEGIIVCVNYSDFLAHTLPYNKTHFDNLIVVTDTKENRQNIVLCYCLIYDFEKIGLPKHVENYKDSEIEKIKWICNF